MQHPIWNRSLGAATVLALAACTSDPTDESGVWFVSTHGQVMTEDRSPLANAFVHAMWFDDRECNTTLIADETTLTDAEGRYSMLLEGHHRDGCLGVTVTPAPGSGLSWIYTAVQVVDLPANDFESVFTLEWVIPSSSGSVSGHSTP